MSLIEVSHVFKDYKVTMTRPGIENVLRWGTRQGTYMRGYKHDDR